MTQEKRLMVRNGLDTRDFWLVRVLGLLIDFFFSFFPPFPFFGQNCGQLERHSKDSKGGRKSLDSTRYESMRRSS